MKYMMIIALIAASTLITACTTNNHEETGEIGLAAKCEQEQGKWIPEAQECEGISKESCEAIGGNFNECASACRNDPDAEICTTQCVLVCEFEA